MSESPEFEVWNHMESGLQMARDDLARSLDPDDEQLFLAIAEQLLASRIGVVVNTKTIPDSVYLRERFPNVPTSKWQEIVRVLPLEPERLNPFLRHAIEIGIAERSVSRMYEALDRYWKLEAMVVDRDVPPRAAPYLRELTETYVFGFDAACIALACSSFEQIAKAALIAVGSVTAGQLNREQPTAETLRLRLRQQGLITSSDAAAEKLIRRRNVVLHRNMFDPKVMPTLSRDSITEFLNVCAELAPSWPAE